MRSAWISMRRFTGDKGENSLPKRTGQHWGALNPHLHRPSVHKYDCLDYFYEDSRFGEDEALADLSAALHENGMKLILDISVNHTGIDHKWFSRDDIWFDKSERGCHNSDSLERAYYFFEEDNSCLGWLVAETLPTLNYTSDALREVI